MREHKRGVGGEVWGHSSLPRNCSQDGIKATLETLSSSFPMDGCVSGIRAEQRRVVTS